jgi:16S rRNA (uracil1498-N3)-methyltransferase
MTARFYVPGLDPAQEIAALPRDEAHHLTKVLRLAVGETVHVFDGEGNEWRALVASAGRDRAEVRLLDRVVVRAPKVALTVVQAVLKGEPMDDVVRDATMIGATAIQPLLTERTTVKASLLATATDRWRRIALASAKQCGAATLPRIGEVQALDDWLGRDAPKPAFILVEPGVAKTPLTVRQLASRPVPAQASLLVGPEGGWTEDERERAIAAGYLPLSLGPMTLRAASVPLAAAAALLSIWDE